MQVRSRHAAGRADLANQIACLELIAQFHCNAVEVTVHRHEPMAVIDVQRVAIEKKVPELDDGTCRRCMYRRALRRRDVHARMRIARLTVEYASRPVRIGPHTFYG